MKLDDAAACLEALGNPTRLKVYRLLVRAGVLIGCSRKSTIMVFARAHACEPTAELADRARAGK